MAISGNQWQFEAIRCNLTWQILRSASTSRKKAPIVRELYRAPPSSPWASVEMGTPSSRRNVSMWLRKSP